MITIITVTKDDKDGLAKTIRSTQKLRASNRVRQIVVTAVVNS